MAEPYHDLGEPAGYGPERPVRAFRDAVVTAPSGIDEFAGLPELDFGPLRVRVPPHAGVRMSVEDQEYSDAVFFDFPSGTVRLSLFAVPRSGRLWPERAEEIANVQ